MASFAVLFQHSSRVRNVARTFISAAPAILPTLVQEPAIASRTSAETSGHALRRTTENENWGVRKLEAQGYKVTLEAAA